MRIVSLLPSATDVVAALGLGADLVGMTFECTAPEGSAPVVVVGGLETAGMTPGEVDAAVRARASAGEDLYTLHADALAGLDADLVLTQDLCRVCALPGATVAEALGHLGSTAQVLTLDPHTLDDVLATVTAVGRAAGVPDRAADLVARLRGRLDAVAAAVAGRPRPRVVVVEWVDPPFTAGHWVPDLVTAAGGEPVGATSGARSVPTTWDEVRRATADLVLVAPCGYGLAAAVEQARSVRDELPGVPVWAIDADGLVVRPGPRLVEGVAAIASVLHPDAVPPSPSVARVRGPGG
ncbi:ABC transporter substrate-binding protein [Geodermatophilus marinus]|uniref:ABC transporter substrate-binding protein n=1 Tax=Geodermatophilus sp. LHW52908 TaxID=2303986 RepID=UPI0018F56F3B|nr:ABC transporter substrate-binding protein [Geodermatophilus sp. LHW52908]